MLCFQEDRICTAKRLGVCTLRSHTALNYRKHLADRSRSDLSLKSVRLDGNSVGDLFGYIQEGTCLLPMPVCHDHAFKQPVSSSQASYHGVAHSPGAPHTIQGGFAHTCPQSGLLGSLQGRPMPRVSSWDGLLPSPLSALSIHLEPGVGSPTGGRSPQPIAAGGALRSHRHSHRHGSRRLRRTSDGPCRLHSSGCLAGSTSDFPNGRSLTHSGRLDPSHPPTSVPAMSASTTNQHKNHQRTQASKVAKSTENQTAYSEIASAQEAGDSIVGCSSTKAASGAAVKRQRLQPRKQRRSPPDEDALQLRPRIGSASVSSPVAQPIYV